MRGRVIEIEIAKGWGKVELEDGRVMSFDVTICKSLIPTRGTEVTVELAPGWRGTEKIASLKANTTLVEVPGEWPFLVTARQVLMLRDGAVDLVLGLDRKTSWKIGDTGYASVVTQEGGSVVGRPAQARPGRIDYIRGPRKATIRPEELSAFARDVEAELQELAVEGVDPDLPSTIKQDRKQMTALAKRLGIAGKRP